MHDVFILNQTNNTNNIEKIQQHFPYARCVKNSAGLQNLLSTVAKKSVTEHIWLFSDNCDYSNFDFDYIPPWHQNEQMQVWPSAKNTQSGDTILFHRRALLEQIEKIPSIQDFDCIHWRDEVVENLKNPEIFIWDKHNDGDETVKKSLPGSQVLRYVGTPLDMLKRTVSKASTPYIWIVSSHVDYSNFNFDWRPDWIYQDYLHVWPTSHQTHGGETLFVNVDHFLKQQDNLERLEHYQNILWHQERLQPISLVPVVRIGEDVRNIGSRLDVLIRACKKAQAPYIWVVHPNIDYSNFDFNWRPGWAIDNYLHVWKSWEQHQSGDTYFINVNEFLRQSVALERLEDYEVINWKSELLSEIVEPEVFIWDSTGYIESKRLLKKFPNAQVIRYVGSKQDMLNRTLRKATTEYIWIIDSKCDYKHFEFKWRPDWMQEKHLHVWPTENQTRGGDTFFVNVAQAKSELLSLENLLDYDVITWHKKSLKEYDPPEIFVWDSTGKGNYLTEWLPNSQLLRYVGTELDMLKRTLNKATTSNIWIIDSKCDYSNFDFSWRPGWDNYDYLHVWPTKHQSQGGNTYFVDVVQARSQVINLERLLDYDTIEWHKESLKEVVEPEVFIWDSDGDTDQLTEQFPDAQVIRHVGTELDMLNKTLRKAATSQIWIIDSKCDYSDFDFHWRPGWDNQSYLHVWPTENQSRGGDTYYVDVVSAKSQVINLERLLDYDTIEWHKDKIKQKTLPEIFIWDGIDNAELLLEQFPDAQVIRQVGTELDMFNRTLRKATTKNIWIINTRCDYSDFDFSWRPGWDNQSYLHVWPTKNQSRGGDTYYVDVVSAKNQCFIPIDRLLDYDTIEWHKESLKEVVEPEVFIWDSIGDVDHIINWLPDAKVIRYVGTELDMFKKTIRKATTKNIWIIDSKCDYSNFDFSWRPGWDNQNYLHVWTTANQRHGGDTYYVDVVSAKTQIINLEQLLDYDTIEWHIGSVNELWSPEVFVWDSDGDTDQLTEQFPDSQIIRYVGTELDMLKRTLNKATTLNIWIIDSKCIYTDFDFSWRPGWDNQDYLHVWPTENQSRGGNTYYLNVAQARSQVINLERLLDYDTIEWHKDKIKQKTLPEIFIWDNAGLMDEEIVVSRNLGHSGVLRKFGNELDMLGKTLRKATTPQIWIIDSNIDYSDFDFSWRPGWDNQNYLHVWPTENQKRGGDTYYVDVVSAKSQCFIPIDRLLDYNTIEWHKENLKEITQPEVFIWDSIGDTNHLLEQFPGAQVIRYVGTELDMLNRTLRKAKTPNIWIVDSKCDYSDFDFNWRPGWDNQSYLHVWPTQDQSRGGDTFFVNISAAIAQLIDLKSLLDYETIEWHKESLKEVAEPEVFIWDSIGNTELLLKQFPNAQVIRHVGTELDMLKRTLNKSTTSNIWIVDSKCDYRNFNFNWRPGWDNQSYLHVWPTENQSRGGNTYFVDAVSAKSQVINLERLLDYDTIEWHKESLTEIVEPEVFIWDSIGDAKHLLKKFPNAQAMRHVGTELDMLKRTLNKATTQSIWIVDSKYDYSNFDFSWRPGWDNQNYLHVWSTENQKRGGDTYFVNTVLAKSQVINLERLLDYDTIEWHKENLKEVVEPEVFIWDSVGNTELLLEQFPDAQVIRQVGTELDMLNRTLRKTTTKNIWIINTRCDYSNFDFSWRPGWDNQDYLHVWPTENQNQGGDTYFVNASDAKSQVINIENLLDYETIEWHKDFVKQFVTPEVFIWDSANDASKLLEQFPNANVMRKLGSNYDMMLRTIAKATTQSIWIVDSKYDYSNFDFSWRPGWKQQKHLHVWSTNKQKGGDTYFVDVKEMQSQTVTIERLLDYDTITWHQKQTPEITKTQVCIWDSINDSQRLLDQFPDAIVLRKVGSRFDMMQRTLRKVTGDYIWIIDSKYDYSKFDFNWRPDWATQNQLHVWPTNNQIKGGDTFYVDVKEMQKQSLSIDDLDQYNSVFWHKQSISEYTKPSIYIWDNFDNNENLLLLQERFPDATVIRNIGSKLDMMNRTIGKCTTEYAFVISTSCDYTDFDFSWRPEWEKEKHLHVWPTHNQKHGGDTYFVNVKEMQKQSLEIEKLLHYDVIEWHTESLPNISVPDIVIWDMGGNSENNFDDLLEKYPSAQVLRYLGTHLEMVRKSLNYVSTKNFWIMSNCCEYENFDPHWKPDWKDENSIHCWASGEQKFGDTFYIPKNSVQQEIDDLDKLEYYSSIIWNDQGYIRKPWPVNYVPNDIYSAIRDAQFTSMYEYFVAPGSTLGSTVDVNLWEKRPLIAYNKNGHVSLCPRDTISQISTRLADYPYIQYHTCKNSTQKPQDIVFISYDEKDADLNYKILKRQHPNAKRVHGIEGMVNALKQAARIAKTPWYFAVFARTEVAEEFKFDFNPDYLETPGNYIFNAYNRITRNTYGHGAVLLYHNKTVAEAETWGYDFTTSFPYTAIPLLSCYNDARTPWEAWRTSFREVLKLKSMDTIESRYRLSQWLNVGDGPVGDWSIAGATDAMEYTGELDQANDWNWLNDFFKSKHEPDQLPLQQ